MNKIKKQPTVLFWIISSLAIFWNLMGIFAYLGQAYMTDDILTTLSEAEQLYYANLPSWALSAFALAVFSGFFGSLFLIWRKKLAFYFFVMSFIALLVQMYHSFFVQQFIEFGGTNIIIPTLTFIIALFLIYFSNSNLKSGILK